jgi:hypothetical protein
VLTPILTLALQAADATAPPARPLFEPELRVLHEFVGEAAGDQFGWIGRNVGDCDRDGVSDLVLTAPTKALGGAPAGRAYVHSGKSGALLFSVDGEPGDLLGWGSEGAGDVDGDGAADVIIGAPGALAGRGRVRVHSGKDGSLLRSLEGEAAGDAFGKKVSGAGDVDGDGHADLLIGADGSDALGTDAGRAYLHSGATGELLYVFDGEAALDHFGVALTARPHGDSVLIAVGAADAGPKRGGRVYVFRYEKGEPEWLFSFDADETGVALGAMFLSILDDVDGDGHPDVYASDWQNGAKGNATGRIYVLSGRDGKVLLTLTGERAGDGFGIGTSEIGDVDGDARADLLIGAWQSPEGAPSGGKCTLHSGRDGSLLGSWVATLPNETFGFDTTGMGDVDGDGATDFLITNAWSEVVHGKQTGRAFLVAGTPRRSPK